MFSGILAESASHPSIRQNDAWAGVIGQMSSRKSLKQGRNAVQNDLFWTPELTTFDSCLQNGEYAHIILDTSRRQDPTPHKARPEGVRKGGWPDVQKGGPSRTHVGAFPTESSMKRVHSGRKVDETGYILAGESMKRGPDGVTSR